MITIKTALEIKQMRATCQLAAKILKLVEPRIQPGVTTDTLNKFCHRAILEHGATPSSLHYKGFPKAVCISVNHQVCHGIPGSRVLREGDIVNIDITTNLNGFHGDTSKTYPVGHKISPKARRIIQIAQRCLEKGISVVRPGGHFGDVGDIIERHARKFRCSVVREYCGHGIGCAFHEEPAVMHFGQRGHGEIMRPGMIFTIEPMINLGKAAVKLMPDQWTVVTKDHSLSAQFEHTVLVTETGHEILTNLENGSGSTGSS